MQLQHLQQACINLGSLVQETIIAIIVKMQWHRLQTNNLKILIYLFVDA